MIISELVEKLENIRAEFGDLDVYADFLIQDVAVNESSEEDGDPWIQLIDYTA